MESEIWTDASATVIPVTGSVNLARCEVQKCIASDLSGLSARLLMQNQTSDRQFSRVERD
jgi:hypothetical protein